MKITDQLFHRIALNLSFLVCLHDQAQVTAGAFWAGIPLGGGANPICLITGNIYFDEPIKMVLPKFLHWKVSFSLCKELFCGADLLLGWSPNGDFENSIIPSTFISGTSYCKKKNPLYVVYGIYFYHHGLTDSYFSQWVIACSYHLV